MGASASPRHDARALVRLVLVVGAFAAVAAGAWRVVAALHAVHAPVAMAPGTAAALLLVVGAVTARDLTARRAGAVLGALACGAVSALLAAQVERHPGQIVGSTAAGAVPGGLVSGGTVVAVALLAGLALVHLAPGLRPAFRRSASLSTSAVTVAVIAASALAPGVPAPAAPSLSPVFAALGLAAFVVVARWAGPTRSVGLRAWSPWLAGGVLAALALGAWSEGRATPDRAPRAPAAGARQPAPDPDTVLPSGGRRDARSNTLVLWCGLMLAVSVGCAVRRVERLTRVAERLAAGRRAARERLASLGASHAELEQEALELRRGEQEMRRQAREKRRVLDSLSAFLIAVDGEGVVTEWNFVSSEVFGLRGSEALGRPFDMLPLPWDEEMVREAVDACLATGSRQVLEHQPLRGDEGRIVSLTVNPTQAGARRGFALVGADVTERRLLELQLRASQKLESVGTLAAGIAHEINTPMQFVGDNVRFVGKTVAPLLELLRLAPELRAAAAATPGELTGCIDAVLSDVDVDFTLDELPAALEETLEGIERVSTIVRAMKEFSHPGGEESAPSDVNEAVRTTVAVARNEYKYVADVELSLEELPAVDCWIGDLKQVFLNLLVNGTHAIKERLGEETQERGRLTVSSRVDGDHVELRFGDTGTGIPEHARDQVFDQFFTTKEVGRGTGMGLAICRSVIVEKHGGTIDFESEVGVGTTFVIRLPTASPVEAAAAAQDHDPTAVRG